LSEHPKYATVAKPRFDGAGAPDIDIAPLRDAFRTWWAQNDRFLADGDTGDVLRLYLMLRQASANAICSSPDAPSAL
jgi:hypothetical protein